MDGNPNVGADTIAASLATQRAHVLEHYVADVAGLARLLSQTEGRVGVDAELIARLADYRMRFPQAAARIRPRHADMPYRCLLTLIGARLEATGENGHAEGYVSPAELLDDLQLIDRSLLAHRGLHAGAYAVRRLIWRVRTFGFHLARLDVRQDSRVHDDALAALFDDADWASRDEADRAARLQPYAGGRMAFASCDDATAASLRDVFATLRDTRMRYGTDATGLYVISMARSAADVLAVLALARYGGLTQSVPPLRGEGWREGAASIESTSREAPPSLPLPSGERIEVRGQSGRDVPQEPPASPGPSSGPSGHLRPEGG
jgi:phosphoenolpyruvate carboxylase